MTRTRFRRSPCALSLWEGADVTGPFEPSAWPDCFKTMKAPAVPNMKVMWYLTGRFSVMGKVECIDVNSFPFQIGRRHGLPLSLSYATVSGLHAEILCEDGYLQIRDAGST